jgi:hypothetical protein
MCHLLHHRLHQPAFVLLPVALLGLHILLLSQNLPATSVTRLFSDLTALLHPSQFLIHLVVRLGVVEGYEVWINVDPVANG